MKRKNTNPKKQTPILILGWFLLLSLAINNLRTNSQSFKKIIAQAKGQTVYFNAWGGNESINQYLGWISDEMESRYRIRVKHVKVSDIAIVTAQILAEKRADREGSVDLVWINGENFKTMKKNRLLYGPFTSQLPSIKWVDFKNKPSTLIDFSEPVEGMEAPWGMAQLVFIYDQARTRNIPKDVRELLKFAQKNPGQITYPQPPDFHGSSFIKQLLLELVEDDQLFQKPVEKSHFISRTQPLWNYLDEFHPYLWRGGKNFPPNLGQLHQLFSDGALLISFTFNPNEASHLINQGEFPPTIRTYVHQKGMLGNTHFLAIPYNSSAKEGALVLINFLLSPEAQARKADLRVWGDPTVLDLESLDAEGRNLFKNIPQGIANLSEEQLGKILLEPHSSWVSALEREWLRRYGN